MKKCTMKCCSVNTLRQSFSYETEYKYSIWTSDFTMGVYLPKSDGASSLPFPFPSLLTFLLPSLLSFFVPTLPDAVSFRPSPPCRKSASLHVHVNPVRCGDRFELPNGSGQSPAAERFWCILRQNKYIMWITF